MSLDAADLIDSLGGQTYTVTRTPAAQIVKGRAVDNGPASTIVIEAGVQPASGRDLLRLPEGRRSTATQVLWTTTELLVGGQNAPTEADQVSIDGVQWEVQLVERWRDSSFFRCVVQSVA